MKQHEINLYGTITSNGKVAMYMAEFKAFASKWKNTRVIATFRVYQPGTSAALRGYYYNYIVPTFKRALWETGERKTDEQVEQYLRELSPVMHRQEVDEETGKYQTEIRHISDLDNSELIEHIDFLKQFGAEELNIYIDDPNIL